MLNWRCSVNKRMQRITALAVLMGLLAACSSGETPTTAAPTAQPSPTPEATAPPPTPTPEPLGATVVEVINDVDAHSEPQGEWEDAVVDMPIYLGGEVWAQEASTSRVGVGDDLIRVAPNTIFTFEQPDEDTLQLALDEGQVWVNVEGLEPGETFQVETPAAVASVRGTRFGVQAEPDQTIVSTWVGTTTVTAVGSTVVVTRGMQTIVPLGGPPGAPVPMLPPQPVQWGMAAGPGLSVVLPALDVTSVFTYPGFPQNVSCSRGGNYFAIEYFNPTLEDFGYIFYDVPDGNSFTATLPLGAEGVTMRPDGNGLAYVNRETDEVCTAHMDGSNPSCFSADIIMSELYWSPDGEWLLFYPFIPADFKDAFNVYKVRPDGSDLTQVTNNTGGDARSPAWSPDDSLIAYHLMKGPEEPAELWVTDGTDAKMVFEGTRWHDPPAWNPRDSQIAVPGYGEGEYGHGGGLWIVSLDGSDPWMVPGTEGSTCSSPVWSPTDDGWPLLFRAYPPEGEEGDGSKEEKYRLWWYTPDEGQQAMDFADVAWGPAWCLDGTQQAVFGFSTDYGSSDYQGAAYFFQVEPDFWP
jgi:hypothetical protein